MIKTSNSFEFRAADGNDATGILTVLQEVAPEVPLTIDTLEHQEAIQAIIAECCDSGDSRLAVDADGTVVGFVLAKPDRLERFLHRNQALSSRYIGVSKICRRCGIFAALMDEMTNKGAPLTASVLHANRSAMADRLVKLGYKKSESDDKETRLRWDP
jgi:hypothetical protein